MLSFFFRHGKDLYKRLYMMLMKPILDNPFSFITYVVLLLLPELFTVVAHARMTYLCGHLSDTVAFDLTFSYLLCALTTICSRIRYCRLLLQIVFHTLLYVLSFANVVLLKVFGMGISYSVLQMITETNANEASEFFATYCTTTMFCFIVLLYVAVGLAELYMYTMFRKRILKVFLKWILPLLIVGAAFYESGQLLSFFSKNSNKNILRVYTDNNPVKNTLLWNLNQTALLHNESKDALESLSEIQSAPSVDSCTFTSPHIVVVIGESYNKHHSNLYNYDLNTTPRLFALKDSGLFVFSDVVSSVNATHISFQNFLSLASVDDSLYWYEAPLFPALFKSCGYNVIFYSNQFVKEPNPGVWDLSTDAFLNNSQLESQLFSARNDRKYRYDGELIDQLRIDRKAIEVGAYNLTMVHLIGQHIDPVTKYPPSETYFTADSIVRPDLTREQRLQVANYDNATRYNDSVVRQIIDMYRGEDAIVIYFADHGDEANDFRLKVGRSSDFKEAGAPCMHCQLDIPFLIYATESYRQSHPAIIAAIERSLDKPFMTDDLPHLLLELAGIHTRWYNPRRSLINDRFDTHRRRLIYKDGDMTDYDEVCGR